MASQRVLLFTIAGDFADAVWDDIRRWSDARVAVVNDEWSPDDWPDEIKHAIDDFVSRLETSGYSPPVLYRSEHVDCWSTGDVFETALVKGHPDDCRRLFTASHEIIATRVRYSEQIIPDRDSPDETVWLYTHINEAVAAWSAFAENTLVLIVRTVLGASWKDEEITRSLSGMPAWWTATEQAGSRERQNRARYRKRSS